jgi:long-chain fatty acid transport protein
VIGLSVASDAAKAGGFAIREQSTTGLGAAFAGIAAGPDISSIFWNPAAVSLATGIEAEFGASLIIPDTSISGTATWNPAPPLNAPPPAGFGPAVPLSFLDSNGGSIADPALIPTIYSGAPVTDRLSLGMGFNGAFGLVTKPDNGNWAGKFEARTSVLRTYNFNPVASYKVTPNLVVGAGGQMEYAKATLKSAFPNVSALADPANFGPQLPQLLFGGPNPTISIDGNGFAFGYTLGLLWNALPGTDIGLGFRSSLDHNLRGDIAIAGAPGLGSAKFTTHLEMPEIVTASLRQRVTERVTLLGTVEWTNWSRLDKVVLTAESNNPAFGAVVGQAIQVLPLDWHDGWFFSGGAEFALNERTVLRAGGAYEESPIQNATERTARDPDSNRVWLSLGAGYNWSEMTTLNLAYSHVFFEGGSIDRTTAFQGLGTIHLLGEADQAADIVSVSVKIKLGPTPTDVALK